MRFLSHNYHPTNSSVPSFLLILILLQAIYLPTVAARTTAQTTSPAFHQCTLSTSLAFPPTKPRPNHRGLSNSRYDSGTSCLNEGQWNYMKTSYQRCVGGQWSGVTDCNLGTECIPAGLTMTIKIRPAYAPGSGDGETSDASCMNKGLFGWVLRGGGLW